MSRKKPRSSDSPFGPGSVPNDAAGISAFADGDHDEEHAPADTTAPAPRSSAVPPSAVIDLLATYGEFFAVGERAYWQRTVYDDNDPDTWEPAVPVASAMFRREVQTHYPKLTAKSQKMKDVVALAEDTGYRALQLPSHVFSTMRAETPTSPFTLLFAISPTIVLSVSTQGIMAKRNGPDAGVFLTLPTTFRPITWRALSAHYDASVLTNPTMHACLLNDLPPPIVTDGIGHDENRALLLAYWFGLFFTAATQGRPVLGVFGAWGSGKTVTARALGKLFYGPDFDVSGGVGGGRAVKDLVAELSAMPFAVRDDMNRQPEGIVDTICQFATGARVALSSFHETLAFETHRVESNLALTAHTPTWALRADLLSRMIPIRLSRPDMHVAHLTEAERYARLERCRVSVFAQTLAVIHAAMQVKQQWVCSTRFEDWETWVRRCAHVGGWHNLLHGAFGRLEAQRVNLARDTDPWVAALYQVSLEIRRRREEEGDIWFTAADLYDYVSSKLGATNSADPAARPSYSVMRSQNGIGAWLARVEQQGGSVVEITRGPLLAGGVNTWSLMPKGLT